MADATSFINDMSILRFSNARVLDTMMRLGRCIGITCSKKTRDFRVSVRDIPNGVAFTWTFELSRHDMLQVVLSYDTVQGYKIMFYEKLIADSTNWKDFADKFYKAGFKTGLEDCQTAVDRPDDSIIVMKEIYCFDKEQKYRSFVVRNVCRRLMLEFFR